MKRKRRAIKTEKGQIIFMVLVIIAAVLSTGLLLGVISIQKLHSMSEMGESVKAYYAAESGAECQLYKNFKDSHQDCDSNIHMTNETSYQIEEITQATSTLVRVVGKSKTAQRAIEIRY